METVKRIGTEGSSRGWSWDLSSLACGYGPADGAQQKWSPIWACVVGNRQGKCGFSLVVGIVTNQVVQIVSTRLILLLPLSPRCAWIQLLDENPKHRVQHLQNQPNILDWTKKCNQNFSIIISKSKVQFSTSRPVAILRFQTEFEDYFFFNFIPSKPWSASGSGLPQLPQIYAMQS